MEPYAPLDINGKFLEIGDWVLVIAAPLSIGTMPDESKEAFSNAVGHTFQVESFDEVGHLRLEIWRKVESGTIWLEPFLVERFRRYKKLSKVFQKARELETAPRPPRYGLKFDIRLRTGVDLEEFGFSLICLGSGGGFACWPDERRVEGTIYADKSEPDPIKMLESIRLVIGDSQDIVSHELGQITDADEPD